MCALWIAWKSSPVSTFLEILLTFCKKCWQNFCWHRKSFYLYDRCKWKTTTFTKNCLWCSFIINFHPMTSLFRYDVILYVMWFWLKEIKLNCLPLGAKNEGEEYENESWNVSSLGLFRFVGHFRSTSGFLVLLPVHFWFAFEIDFVDITLIIRVNCWNIYCLKICRFLIGCQLFDSTSYLVPPLLFSNSHP